MKIINNKIYIVQGETPTYKASVIDRDTGHPYMILKTDLFPVVEFIVRPSIYNRADDFVYRAFYEMDHIHQFETDEVREYKLSDWKEPPLTGDDEKLHYMNKSNGAREYAYWDGSKWVKYDFEIEFSFDYEAMKKLEAKTYKYDITLYYGQLKEKPIEGENPVEIKYKKPLLEATDFVVGGSLSE
jgi:hypothetical protein